MFHMEMTTTYWWLPDKCEMYEAVLVHYIDRLKSQHRSGTTSIAIELGWANKVRKIIAEARERSEDEGDDVEVSLYGKDWAKLHSLTARYLSWQRQLLTEGLRVNVPEAMEPEQEQIRISTEALQAFEKMGIPRGDTINIEFYIEPMTDKPTQSQSFTIETFNNFNGQFVGFNNGTVNQNNDIEVSIGKISEAINEAGIPNEAKQEYLADLVSVNAQIKGGNPDKNFVGKALDKIRSAINTGGDLATIATLVLPHLDKLQHLIK